MKIIEEWFEKLNIFRNSTRKSYFYQIFFPVCSLQQKIHYNASIVDFCYKTAQIYVQIPENKRV